MDDAKAHLISYLSTLALLGAVSLTLALTGNSHLSEALVALFTYAGVNRPGGATTLPRAVASLAPVTLALAMSVAASGCGASFPAVVAGTEVGVEVTCAGTRKLCDAFVHGTGGAATFCADAESLCSVVAPTTAKGESEHGGFPGWSPGRADLLRDSGGSAGDAGVLRDAGRRGLRFGPRGRARVGLGRGRDVVGACGLGACGEAAEDASREGCEGGGEEGGGDSRGVSA